MALTDTFTKTVKHSGKPAGDKHSDGGGMYLHVKAAGKYWRMAYRIHDKQRTLYIGVYPAVSLAQAREARKRAKELLAQDIDPSTAKREEKHAAKLAASNTYESVAREFHQLKAPGWSAVHSNKWLRQNELYLFPVLGEKPLESIKPKDVLEIGRAHV